MATFETTTRIDAPLEDVWQFYTTPHSLETVTPGFMNLTIETITSPTTPPDTPNNHPTTDMPPDESRLQLGDRVRVSIQPFGVGPRQRWTSHIVEIATGETSAYFRDEMHNGPFPHWEHTHHFTATDDDGTIVRDHIDYHLPCGALGQTASPLAWVGLTPLFRARHRRAKQHLE